MIFLCFWRFSRFLSNFLFFDSKTSLSCPFACRFLYCPVRESLCSTILRHRNQFSSAAYRQSKTDNPSSGIGLAACMLTCFPSHEKSHSPSRREAMKTKVFYNGQYDPAIQRLQLIIPKALKIKESCMTSVRFCMVVSITFFHSCDPPRSRQERRYNALP